MAINILLYNFGYRGDILVVGQNFTRELMLRYPGGNIDLMLRPRMREAQDFLEPLALYHQFLFGEKKDFHALKQQYDLAFMIDENVYPEGNLRTFFTTAGFPFRQHQLTFMTLESDDEIAHKIVANFKRPLIATQDDMSRKWPQPKVKELWDRLSDVGSIIFVGPDQIYPGMDRTLTFRESAALLKQVDIFVGIDSGIAHLAALVGIQTILLPPVFPESWISPTEYANHFIKDENDKHISIRPPLSEFCGHYFCLQQTKSGGIKRPSGNPLLIKCSWKKKLAIFGGISCYNKITVDSFYESVINAMENRKLI